MKPIKPTYDPQPPRYCNQREGWIVEYIVTNGKDLHGATEGFVKKKSFEAARLVYEELKFS